MANKQFLRLTCALTSLLCAIPTLSPALAAAGAAPSPEVTVIVATDGDFDSSLLDKYDVRYVYSGLFDGFAAVMPLSEANALSRAKGVGAVYQSAERKTVQYSSDAADIDAAAIFPRDLIESELLGEGTVAAVLDSSFDAYHEMFVLSDDTETALGEKDIADLAASGTLSVSNSLKFNESTGYVSEKVPFAYDYADSDPDVLNTDEHGTHVAGIIGANNASGLTEGFDGVAPECQLLLMKVSSDSDEYISDAAVLAALCDAVALGADVVNMSFGESSALSDMYLSEINYSDIIAQALAQGTYVFAAAGNESRLGSGSAYDAPLSFAEDNGTVGLPANLADCVSVASADYSYPVYSSFLLAADATKILYYEDSAGGFTDSFANKTLRLVPVPGVGAEEDYEDIDVAGKIALIKRGEITFADKLTYAAEAGAKGAVIYDNAESSEPFTMQVNEGQIPSVSVTAADGELLLGEGSVYLQSGAPASYENKNAGMSSFSSWGPTPSLGLKPDIAAWGGNIYSCAPGDRYVSMSGTSMASPLCAAYALLAIESGNHDGRDLRAVMMNTASPVIDSVSGKEYSPRSQGAGLCDIDAALNAGLIITGDSGAAKIELGDGLSSSFKFTVTAENITETDITAAVSGSVLTDDYYYYGEKYVNAGSPLALSESSMRIDGGKNVNRYSEDSSVSEITVPAGDSVSFTVSVKLSSSEFAELAEAFDDGFYIDGYVYLETEGEQYSIPFMGYHGDWSALPVFSYDESFFGIVLSSLFVSGSDAYVYKLGTAVFSDDITSDSSLIAISPNGDGFGDYIGFDLALLRTVTSFEAEITDAGGEQVYTMAVDFPLVKAFDDGSGELNIYNVYDLWDGTDENDHDYTYPDGVYTITLRAYTEGQDEPQSVSYDFRIDTVKPSLDGWRIVEQDGKTILELDVSDDLGIMYAEVYSRYNADQTVKFDLVPSEAHTKTLRANITELENNGYFYLDLLDYAANQSTYRIDISGGN